MTSYNSQFEVEPQTSYIVGVSFKANLDFLFLRTGVDIAFPLIEGDVLENGDATDPIEKYSIGYTGLPLFVGVNVPVFDIGEFYLGGGIAYFLATGTVTHGGTEDTISATALGFGFIAGMQLHVSAKIRLYMEWEYIDARSGASMNTAAAPTAWDNLYIDFPDTAYPRGDVLCDNATAIMRAAILLLFAATVPLRAATSLWSACRRLHASPGGNLHSSTHETIGVRNGIDGINRSLDGYDTEPSTGSARAGMEVERYFTIISSPGSPAIYDGGMGTGDDPVRHRSRSAVCSGNP